MKYLAIEKKGTTSWKRVNRKGGGGCGKVSLADFEASVRGREKGEGGHTLSYNKWGENVPQRTLPFL